MSTWLVGLALAAGYLINKNIHAQTQLENAEAEYNNAAKPSTDGATSAEVRRAWGNTDFVQYGDMQEHMPQGEKTALNQKVQQQMETALSYDAGASVPQIQGVLMTYDHLGA